MNNSSSRGQDLLPAAARAARSADFVSTFCPSFLSNENLSPVPLGVCVVNQPLSLATLPHFPMELFVTPLSLRADHCRIVSQLLFTFVQ